MLPASYPAPTAADLDATRTLLAATAPGDVLLIDGLAYGAMPAELIGQLHRGIIALVHHPLCLEAGIGPARTTELHQLETAALALAQAQGASGQQFLRAVIVGYVISGKLPEASTWLGAAVIISAGLYLAWTETRKPHP